MLPIDTHTQTIYSLNERVQLTVFYMQKVSIVKDAH